jgi:hypothetical protein
MKYKIIYHEGATIDVKTKVKSGLLFLSDDALVINEDSKSNSISFTTIESVEMFRLHGLGRMIKIKHSLGTLYLTVVRLNLFGYFVIINFLKTGRIYDLIKAKTR